MIGKISKLILFSLLISLAGLIEFPSAAMAEGKTEPVVVIFDDELISCCYTYQNPDLFEVDAKDKKSGKASLKLGWDVPAGNWPGAGIGLEKATDLTKYRENGVLSLWIKSKNGGEKIEVGFLDINSYITVRPLNPYIGPLTTEWQKVWIPLADFSDNATHWDDELQKNLPGYFKWDAVVEFSLLFGKADGKEHWVSVDDVMVSESKVGGPL